MKPLRDILLRDDLGEFSLLVQAAVAQVEGLHSETSINLHCDWKIAIENTLEACHVDHVHPDSLAKLGLKSRGMKRHGKNSLESFDITDARALKGLRALEPYFPHCFFGTYWHLFLYPHTTLSTVCGYTYSLQNYFPTESGTVLLSRLYLPVVRAGAPDLAFYFDSAAKFNRQVFEEDARLCEQIHLRCVGQQMRPQLKRLEWFAHARDDIHAP